MRTLEVKGRNLFGITKYQWHKIILTLLVVLAVVFVRSQHDYRDYEKKWVTTLSGQSVSQAYGPAHNIMAYAHVIWDKLPRLIFSLLSLLALFYLNDRVRQSGSIAAKDKKLIQYFLFYNPIFWVFIVFLGSNDGYMAPFILLGIVFFHKQKYTYSGLAFGFATLIKFMPIFMVPFLCVSRKKINWKFIIAYLAILFIMLVSAYYRWGSAIFEPFIAGSARESKMLSIFRYLRGEYSVLQLFNIQSVDFASTFTILLLVSVLFIFFFLYSLPPLQTSILSLLTVLLFYSVGHHQFHFNTLLTIVFLFIIKHEEYRFSNIWKYGWAYFFWIAFTVILFAATDGYYRKFNIIREFIGLPTFIVHGLFAVAFFRHIWQKRDFNALRFETK